MPRSAYTRAASGTHGKEEHKAQSIAWPLPPLSYSAMQSASRGGPLSLPLIEGLNHRQEDADTIVGELFAQWRAATRIARAIGLRWKGNKVQVTKKEREYKRGKGKEDISINPPVPKRRRRGEDKRYKESHSMKVEQSLSPIPDYTLKTQLSKGHNDLPFKHWLLSSMVSSSFSERQVACKILAQGCPLDRLSKWSCIQVLCSVIYKETSSSTQGFSDVVACVAFLKHIVTNTLTDSERLAFCRSPVTGLKKMCGTIWRMALAGRTFGNPPPTRSPIQVCFCLVDLLDSIVMTGTSESVNMIHKMLWSPNQLSSKAHEKGGTDLSISSLAFLVATYHLWCGLPSSRSMEHYAGLLKRLIDPSALPDVTMTMLNLESKAGCGEDVGRLSETFASAMNRSQASSSNRKGNTTLSNTTSGHSFTEDPTNSGEASSSRSAALAAMMESSHENRSVMESVSRLIGSLYGSSGERTERTAESAAEDNANIVDGDSAFHAMNETDDEDDEVEKNEEVEDNDDDAASDHDGADVNVDDSDHDEEDGDDNGNGSSDEDIAQDEDEELISDEEGDEIVEDDEDDDEDEVIIHEDDLPEIEEGLLEIQRGLSRRERTSSAATEAIDQPSVGFEERSKVYLEAAMEVLMIQYPNNSKVTSSFVSPLSLQAEGLLLSSILKIVKPEKKPFDAKICLRRAPTQEEFFRGSLSKNPVMLSMLNSRNSENQNEPTVRDLRQYIANQLQMGDSSEMIECLIANKILDVDLKLRVVSQTLWKDHCIRLSNSSSGSTLSAFLGEGSESRTFSSSSGISLMLSSSFARSFGSSSAPVFTASDAPEILPPMLITYRLIGVDGEATEDTVSSLNDPEAPSESLSSAEMEDLMEKRFGNTKVIMKGRGHVCLMQSLESDVSNTLRKIRRDDVGCVGTHSRDSFHRSLHPGLSIILCCAKLSANRRLLLSSRAPACLLRLLLDVLHSLQDDKTGEGSKSNPTAKSLQELIEVLASEISGFSSEDSCTTENMEEGDTEEDTSTLRLLIQGIETSSLSAPLRNIIAKLLPYLTYGKVSLSKELATEFLEHVDSDKIGDFECQDVASVTLDGKSVLMDTFIHASSSLPANEVCNALRLELLKCGFAERIAMFILQNSPTDPPHWSAALWTNACQLSKQKQRMLNIQWQKYSEKRGLKPCFDILVGLSKQHLQTQNFIGSLRLGNKSFIQLCHWLEATSDTKEISMKKLALVAEMLLDHLVECENTVSTEIRDIRNATRDRKKEIAMERRNKALMNMSKFGGAPLPSSSTAQKNDVAGQASSVAVRGSAASLFAPVLGLFNPSVGGRASQRTSPSPTSESKKVKAIVKTNSKPSWMEEIEDLEDETGLVCSVCQEGLKNQPRSLLGLYCFVKRVSLPSADSRLNVDGTTLLTILPNKLPASLESRSLTVEWYQSGKAAGNELKEAAQASIANRRRDSYYTTTVSAANAIHVNCHARARQADRNHPKAPKSEWEGACLRNSRVNCNVILPLVSGRTCQVPLGHVEQALTDHQVAIANLIGSRPKSNLWTVLHDVRLLLLRIAYGEPLNADCGGGSLLSNSKLLFYQLSMAESFEREAQVDSPASSLHARNLSSGFLAALDIISADDSSTICAPSFTRAIADSSVMATLTCILFHNTDSDLGSVAETCDKIPHPKRRFVIGKEAFLRGLLNYAGCRQALGHHDSGCLSGRSSSAKTSGSTAFTEWGSVQVSLDAPSPAKKQKTDKASVDDFAESLRPFIMLYALLDQLSSDFTPNMDDQSIEGASERLFQTIESCQKSKNIYDLLQKGKVTLSHDEIMRELQKGMTSA